MSAYIHATAPLPRRSVALIAIVGLHAAFILAFTSGLVQKVSTHKPIPIFAEVVDVKQEPIEPVPLPEPMIERFVISVPSPPVTVEYAPEAPVGTSGNDTLKQAYSGAAANEDAGGSFVGAGIGRNFPNPDSFYPPSAVRQEIEGKAVVRVCVGPNGKLAGAPQVAQSTQNRMLDEAALRLARAGNYVAGSRAGIAVTDCFNFQTTFQLKGRH